MSCQERKEQKKLTIKGLTEMFSLAHEAGKCSQYFVSLLIPNDCLKVHSANCDIFSSSKRNIKVYSMEVPLFRQTALC